MDIRRVVVVCVGILVLGLAPTLVPAQGLLPGLPALGSTLGGPASCGVKDASGFPGPTFYIGWQVSAPTSFAMDAATLGVGGVTNVSENYRNPGLWLGLTVPVPLSESFSVLASGWYLIPGTTGASASESYSPAGLGNRSWSAKTNWWFVDGLLAFTPRNNFALLAGLRYDYFSTKFTADNQAGFAAFGLGSDEAELDSYNVVPLIGLQFTFPCGQNNLILRAVGFPALVGSLKYGETLGNVGLRLDTSGNWNGNNGWFFEAFGEYQCKPFGPSSSLGFFMRWNYTHGTSELGVNLLGAGVATDTFGLRFERSALTIGGSVNVNFVTPL